MGRAPGFSARLKLTLSYAGFLMVAGALLLAATLLIGLFPGLLLGKIVASFDSPLFAWLQKGGNP